MKLKQYVAIQAGMISSVLLGCMTYFEAPRVVDPFLERPAESKLEKRIGEEIYVHPRFTKKRKDLVEHFEKLYDSVSQSWDNFDSQFNLANDIELYTMSWRDKIEIGGSVSRSGYLRLYPGNFFKLDRDTFSHELGHLWHLHGGLTLDEKEKFDLEWNNIAGDIYTGKKENTTPENVLLDNSVSHYALKNQKEDVAETFELVYGLCHPNIKFGNFPNEEIAFRKNESGWGTSTGVYFTPESTPKIISRVELLNKYGAISKREANHAIRELNGYRINSRVRTHENHINEHLTNKQLMLKLLPFIPHKTPQE